MVAATVPLHSSPLLDLARAGDFSALAYWINRVLIPDGFYAQVRGGVTSGCVDVCVELPAPRAATQSELRSNIIRRICHQLWQLNSTAIYGVKVSGSLPGQAEVLWQQSVRIVTPANQQLPWSGAAAFDWGAVLRPVVLPVLRGAVSLRAWVKSRYKALRLLLLAGSAVAVFSLGSWLSWRTSPAGLDRPPTARIVRPELVETVPVPERAMPETSAAPDIPDAPPASRSGLARIRSLVDKIARPNVTAIAPPAIRAERSDVVLLFGGDVSFSGPLAGENARAFRELGVLSAADVTTLTLESPFSAVARDEAEFTVVDVDPDDRSIEGPAVEADEVDATGAIGALQGAGIDVLNLANGRILDDGERGLNTTLDRLESAQIATLGAGRSVDEAARARIVEIKGVKIAYLGYATADYTVAHDRRSGVNEARYERIREDVASLRDRVDWIVVNYHWGDTASSYPAQWQTQLARQTIDAGADAIVGHSPNALQGAETYRDRPIVYSLGKLLKSDRYGFGGEAALLRLRLDGESIAADFIPVELWDGRPVAAAPDSARWIVQRMEDLSQGFARPLALLAENVDGLPSKASAISTERHRLAREAIETSSEADTASEPERNLAPDAAGFTDELTEKSTDGSSDDPADAPARIVSPIARTTANDLASREVNPFDSALESIGGEIAPSPDPALLTEIAPTDIESDGDRAAASDTAPASTPDVPVSFDLSRPLAPLAGRLSVERSLDLFDPTLKTAFQPSVQKTPQDVALDFQHPALETERRNLADELAALDLELYDLDRASRSPEAVGDTAPRSPQPDTFNAPHQAEAATPDTPDAEASETEASDTPFSQTPMIDYAPLQAPTHESTSRRQTFGEIGRETGKWSRTVSPAIEGRKVPGVQLPQW